ncbi:MAG TPA: biosynthetic peptidoglycan transglycosylase [Polyangia bacterium]|nr:biosynthetic peptidoglycan transglycosylase [Polyangia bacterium]
MRSRVRTLVAAGLGLLLVAVPAVLGVYWHVEVEARLCAALEARLGRHVVVGSARPLWRGVRLYDVAVFGAVPFEKVPLLEASAVDVDVSVRAALSGRAVIRGLVLHQARMAVVRDELRGTDNVGDLLERVMRPHPAATGSGASAGGGLFPIRLDQSSIALAYRDGAGTRWSVRVEGLDGSLLGGAGIVRARSVRIEVAGAAAEFESARFDIEGEKVWRAESPSARLALAGADDLLAGTRLFVERDPAVGWRLRASAPHARLFATVEPVAGARMTIDADRLPLGALRPLGDPRGIGTAGATLDAHLIVRVRPRQDALGVEGRAEVAGLTLTHPRLTTGVVAGAGLRVAGSLVAAPRRGRVAVDQAVVRVGDLALWVHGALEGLGEVVRGEIDARVDQTQCQAALDSLPEGLAPALAGAALAGSLSARAHVRFDGARWDDLVLDLAVKEHCVVLRDPPRADVTRLRAATVGYRVEDENGQLRDFPLGPLNPDWRPLAQISPHLVGAFLTAEDARFFSHAGFDPDMIRRALIGDLEQGRIERGASTISQQLVKNLYLEKARTWSRKLQEAALTWRLEQALGKRRILELYLNAIELGPGTYGVRQASRRYFGKEPGLLTPLEAAHLASVAPNPKAYWAQFHRGPVGDDWMEKLYDLLGMMHRSHRLSDGDFAASVGQRLHFLRGG